MSYSISSESNPANLKLVLKSVSYKFIMPGILSSIFMGAPMSLAAEESLALEEILVTARRRTESLQDTPISATVMGEMDLARKGLSTVKDITTSVPNVSLSDFAGSNGNVDLVIRGISTNARNVGFESGVSVYVDGVYTGRPLSFNQELVGIQQIEVLRGPQGTVFGKNSTSGALNITTIQPHRDGFDFRATVEYGEYDHVYGNFQANMPMGDSTAFRLTAFRKKREGLVDNLLNGDEYNDEDGYGARFQGKFWLTDRLDITVSADYLEDDRAQSFPEVLSDPTAPGVRTIVNDFVPFEDRQIEGASVTINYELSSGHVLTSITSYRYNEIRAANDNDNTALDLLAVDFYDDQSVFTQELRMASQGGETLDYVVGLYYLDQQAEAEHIGIFGADFSNLILGAGPVVRPVTSVAEVETQSYAFFADAQYHLTESLTLNLGFRFTDEEKDLSMSQLVDPLISLIGIFPDIVGLEDSISETDFSPTVGLSYNFSDNISAYAKVSKAFKSGGWNADFTSATLANLLQFDSESVTNYEAGLKTELLDGRLRLNTAVFYMDYSDLQVSQFLGVLAGGTVISNAGKAELMGVEVDFIGRVTESLSISGGFGYLDSEFDEFENCAPGGVDCKGNQLTNAPKWTASLSLDWEQPLGKGTVLAHFDYAYRSSVYGRPTNLDRLEAGSFGLFNASLGFLTNDESWEFTLWAKNLLDKDYIAGITNDDLTGLDSTIVGYGDPRIVGARATYRY